MMFGGAVYAKGQSVNWLIKSQKLICLRLKMVVENKVVSLTSQTNG
jgi:hypothetical protein